MNSLIELKTKLTHMNWKQVTELSIEADVSFYTIAKIKRGLTNNPRYGTVEKLMKALA